MEIIKNPGEMQDYTLKMIKDGKTVGLVPTMGYLHDGHLELMRTARKECDLVVASIFVNPIQFGVGEDYEEYPRNLERDASAAEGTGVDVIFAPSTLAMYPKGYHTFVEVEHLTDHLCGASRPGHFRGVTTVVTKLFNIVQPQTAYFGQKDAQQVTVVERMVEDLNLPVKIVRVPTVREKDGLAMSSRNKYLNDEERKEAPVLYQSLCAARELVEKGERNAVIVKKFIEDYTLTRAPLSRIDYVEIMDGSMIQPVSDLNGKVLVALAVKFGTTRLIDNMLLEV